MGLYIIHAFTGLSNDVRMSPAILNTGFFFYIFDDLTRLTTKHMAVRAGCGLLIWRCSLAISIMT